MSLFVLVEKR